jgi:hypothetical protein
MNFKPKNLNIGRIVIRIDELILLVINFISIATLEKFYGLYFQASVIKEQQTGLKGTSKNSKTSFSLMEKAGMRGLESSIYPLTLSLRERGFLEVP